MVVENPQCYGKDRDAYAVAYEGTTDVTKEFYLISNGGLVLLLVSVILYYLQAKQDMFDLMRPYVIVANLMTLGWFVAAQYYRFRESGRACSGDYLGETRPQNYGTLYLVSEGQWLMYFIAAQYAVYFLQKIFCICITNRLEAEFEGKKLLLQNKINDDGV